MCVFVKVICRIIPKKQQPPSFLVWMSEALTFFPGLDLLLLLQEPPPNPLPTHPCSQIRRWGKK